MWASHKHRTSARALRGGAVVHSFLLPRRNQPLPCAVPANTVSSRLYRRGAQDMVWNDETIRHLRELWAQGLSTAEIGRRLCVSKNAIVGKAHRLDLDARPSPIRRDVAKPPIDRPAPYPRMAGPTLPPLVSAGLQSVSAPANVQPMRRPQSAHNRPSAIVPTPAPRPVIPSPPIQARRSAPSCCWPIGEPGTKTFRFCDDTSVPGKPYCDEHARLAYVKIRDRKEDAA